ncbi:MAG: 50S ribosomal protein L29 [bacterium]|nr:50S ribosomal protein L29 [bacterium]
MKKASTKSLVELRKDLAEASLKIAARQEKNTNLAKNIRREIARKETEKND